MRSFGILLFALLTGCSLEEAGQSFPIDAGPTKDVVSVDVVSDVAVDGPADATTDAIEEPGPPLPCTTDASVCSGAIPSGWTLTMFSPNRATACPSNAVTSDVVATPSSAVGACTCSCNVTTQPSCAIGQVKGKWAFDNQCGNAWGPWTITTAGQCTDLGVNTTLGSFNSFSKLPLTAGTCSTAAVTDATKLTSTPMRTCEPAAACAEDVCNGKVPSGLRACIATTDDVACPAGPFSDKVAVVGANATLTCDTCSACNVTAAGCGNATVKYWDDAACTMARGTIAADGNCNGTGSPHANHFTYESAVQNVQCVAGTSTPKVGLASRRTICCRP